MAKKIHSVTVKGFLEINFNEGKAIIREITKESENPYDFFKILDEFNGKHISVQIKEEQDLEPIEE